MNTVALSCQPKPVDTESHESSAAAPAVLEAEFDALYAVVFRYLLHRVFDRDLADELTAQTFYRLVRSLHRVRPGRRALEMWLLRIATNLAHSHYRRLRWRKLLWDRWARAHVAKPAEPDDRETTNTRYAHVRAAVVALPMQEQGVVVLRYYSQLPYRDIAEILGCRPAAVRKRLSRALQRLRRRLECAERDQIPNGAG